MNEICNGHLFVDEVNGPRCVLPKGHEGFCSDNGEEYFRKLILSASTDYERYTAQIIRALRSVCPAGGHELLHGSPDAYAVPD